MKPTKMLDVKLRIFSDADRAVLNNSRVHFYCGSTETLAKVVLLDRDAVEKVRRVHGTAALGRGDCCEICR